jgi:hypothetical protein
MESSGTKKLSRLKWILPVVILGVLTSAAYLPTEWPDKVTAALDAFGKRFPQEKVYLHLDKDYYASGETVWFKAYIMVQGLPSLGASNLYVELLDKSGAVITKKRVMAAGAGAAGSIELPENQKPGQYQIRAYTAWMLNFDPAFLYYRNIEVFDARQRAVPPGTGKDTVQPHDFAVQFFPEGGDLMENLPVQVAFKAVDQNGYPIAVTGNILNNKGKTVATVQTLHDGMGSFELTAIAGETYHAAVKSANGEKDVTLPVAKTTGAGLKVYNRGTRIFYQASLPNMEDTAYDRLFLVAQMQQQLVYRAALKVSEGRISGFIPTASIPSGILQLTLFSADGKPLSERLVFIKKNDQLVIHLNNPYINTDERSKNKIEIEIPDTLKTSLSISVTDADLVMKDPDENNIISNMLLTSDLKGYIYNPAWYFSDTTKLATDALDLVMMTNGWRRFSWEKIINNDLPQIKFPYEQGISIKGTAYIQGRIPLSNGKVSMILKHPLDSTTAFTSANTNQMGEFTVDNLQFMDTLDVFYKGSDKDKSKEVNVKFYSHFFDNYVALKSPYPFRVPAPLDKGVLANFLNAANESNRVNKAITNRTIQLKEVNIKEKKIAPEETIDKKYTSGMFTGGDGYTFDLTKETPTALNVFQYLQSRVAGLQITGDYNNPTLSWRGGTPSLYLNEMSVSKDQISNININDIALIKVFRPPFMGGVGGGSGGAIAIYTKRGGDSNDPAVKGFELYKKGGYAIVKEFYSPDYSKREDVHALADKRLTLYWNPRVNVDSASHTAKISFYNNDFTRHFRVIVEGIAEDGRIGRVEDTF